MARQSARRKPTRPGLRQRFLAWWRGRNRPVLALPAPTPALPILDLINRVDPDPPSDDQVIGKKGKGPLWTVDRITVAEHLWGEGFIQPGGPELVDELIRPLSLDNSMQVLDIGAGLGGVARAITKQTDAWVTAFEPDPLLAERGNEYSTKAGLGRKAPVQRFDAGESKLKPNIYDAVISREALFTMPDKPQLIRNLAGALKPQTGQMLFTDYMLPSRGYVIPDLRTWAAVEPVMPDPWSLDEALATMEALRLDVRIRDDISELVHRMIRRGWADFAKRLEGGNMTRGFRRALLKEIEMWAARATLIERGHLKVYRVYARRVGR
ncbi:MAG: class I SAM-dependent methyltransferase [Tistrella sp.]|jgi:SAM-dependent methyltransferase|nr:methyltransferase domain-containing protein [Tistrella mobilis]MBA77616.1 class I SAM-dependent methyltransferase [Tistrella sp.]